MAPHGGARILCFSTLDEGGEWHWFRRSRNEDVHPVDCASYPLVPFSNRIDHGRFHFQGTDYILPANFPPEPHAIHGVGWQGDWAVLEKTPDMVRLRLDHQASDAWPWDLVSEQTIRLHGTGLATQITVQNTSAKDMPAGLGQHPHFTATDDLTLTASIDGVWEKAGDGILPGYRNTTHAAKSDMQDGELPPKGLDTDLDGWDGHARFEWPSAGRWLEMTAPTATTAVYFAPEGRGFVCFEPTTHASNALGRGDHIQVLRPGESMDFAVNYVVGRYPAA
jgi:aldose 1-epimerase